jgi:hypothetical protein
LITEQDIRRLQTWTDKGIAPEEVRAWHTQVLLEMTAYVRFLETELLSEKVRNINLEEDNRFLVHRLRGVEKK